MSGLFVTLEGIDGAGKTALAAALETGLRHAPGLPVTATREPGGTIVGGRIRSILRATDPAPVPTAALFLFLADRAQHVHEVIRPALRRGDLVLCDRYVDSTRAYQGPRYPNPMEHLAFDWLWPHLTLLLDLDVSIAVARIAGRGSAWELYERADYLATVRAMYLDLAAAEPARFLVLDATQPADTLRDLATVAILAAWQQHVDRARGAS